VAATGKAAEADYLQRLGAAEVIDRADAGRAGKPLQKERWAAVVDSVGSHTLANACAQTRYGGVVAACGLAQGMDLPGTVAPFILRGVTLAGMDSVMAPLRCAASRPGSAWRATSTRRCWTRCHRDATWRGGPAPHELMEGKVRGRVVVTIA
jgi:acrylyl-CoA reductase (NADPH)